ncbi:MAG: UvrD-helicase domain-containing protein [Neisseriaceae bacterium]
MAQLTNILDGLNDEQLAAVTHSNKSMLVLAGAGSGKTKVLTTRIAWLIETSQTTPGEILAVTFTNKAAKEMIHRVYKLIDIAPNKLWIGTFHSIALRILSKHHNEAGLNSFFHILDMQDQLNVIKRVIKEANFDEEHYPARELQKFINSKKENGLRSYDLQAETFRQEHWIKLYSMYESICNKDSLVDFTELLLRSYELLSHNKEILSYYQNKFRHILVDEFQDTNNLQYKWIKLFKSNTTNVFAVGDDDQSIYSFRGALVTNMQAFLHDFKISAPIRLQQNYRSTTNILQAANSVINNNSSRIGKNLWTQNFDGPKVKLYEGYTEEDEAFFVMDEIRNLKDSGMPLSEIAVLYRSNAQSRIIEQILYGHNIAYRVYGGLRFFDRQEIKLILTYLRLAVNTNDNDAFLKVVNFPSRGIGIKTIEILQNLATEKNLPLFNACEFLEGKSRTLLGLFISLINDIKKQFQNSTLPNLINYIIDKAGIATYYSSDKKSGKERLENLNELINAVTNFTNDYGNLIPEFLAHATLESADGDPQKAEQAVQLMTVHAAKGLEFKVVFILGLEEGLFPHENSLESEKSTEEERRLMYVAITRAKEYLYLVRACSRLMWGKRQTAPISRFVNEIPTELISNISGISHIGYDTLTANLMPKDQSIYAPNTSNFEFKTSHLQILDKNLTLKIGDLVKHEKFGNGKIVQLNTDGKKMTAEIFFIGMGKKTLDLNIAKIEKA